MQAERGLDLTLDGRILNGTGDFLSDKKITLQQKKGMKRK